jgi:hypothetical protein
VPPAYQILKNKAAGSPEQKSNAPGNCNHSPANGEDTGTRGRYTNILASYIGDSQRLWNGIATEAMVKTIHMGGIPTTKVRLLMREVRTQLYDIKRKKWEIRNESNFGSDVERTRMEERQMREGISEHIPRNDKAQRTHRSVTQIMEMAPEERAAWFTSTSDHVTRQKGSTRFSKRNK